MSADKDLEEGLLSRAPAAAATRAAPSGILSELGEACYLARTFATITLIIFGIGMCVYGIANTDRMAALIGIYASCVAFTSVSVYALLGAIFRRGKSIFPDIFWGQGASGILDIVSVLVVMMSTHPIAFMLKKLA